MRKETIICAAIKRTDGIILAGRNHSFLIQNSPKGTSKEQGFITSEARFVGRVVAAEIAYMAKQIKKPTNLLFSEDITNDNPWAGEVIDRLEAENKKLKEFARHIIQNECWDLQEPDGGDTQDLAEKLGLIESFIATEQDVDIEFDEFEVGDTLFRFSIILKGGKK